MNASLISDAAKSFVRNFFTLFGLNEGHVAEFVDDVIEKSADMNRMCYEYDRAPEDVFVISEQDRLDVEHEVRILLHSFASEKEQSSLKDALMHLVQHGRPLDIRGAGLKTEAEVLRKALKKAYQNMDLMITDIHDHVTDMKNLCTVEQPAKRRRNQ
jgi:hypothetical protein